MRKYHLVLAGLAVSILVCGSFVYYLQSRIEALSKEMTSLSQELDDARQELNELGSSARQSMIIRAFDFTMVLSYTTTAPNITDRPIIVGVTSAIENVTLVLIDDTANMLNLSELLTASRALNISDLGLIGGDYVLVNTFGYHFHDVLIKTTGPVTYGDQGKTITATYYTITGQVDLLYQALAHMATFYFAVQPYQPFNVTATFELWYKVVPLPHS